MNKPVEDQRYGCHDGGPPEQYSSWQLSRLLDAMYSAEQAGLDRQKVFMTATDAMKLEFNYSNWKYIPEAA